MTCRLGLVGTSHYGYWHQRPAAGNFNPVIQPICTSKRRSMGIDGTYESSDFATELLPLPCIANIKIVRAYSSQSRTMVSHQYKHKCRKALTLKSIDTILRGLRTH